MLNSQNLHTFMMMVIVLSMGIQSSAAPPRDAQTHEERLMKLYGHDPHFTRNGEPIIHIGIASEIQQLSIYSPTGFKLYLDGDPDHELFISGLKRWDIRLKRRIAEVRTESWEILDERPVAKIAELSHLEEQWRTRGVDNVVRFQSGIYLPGDAQAKRDPFEARSIMLAHRSNDGLDLSPYLKSRTLPILETLVRPSRGILVAQGYEDQRTKKTRKISKNAPLSTLSAHDLLWFESQKNQPITLEYLDASGVEQKAHYHSELYVIVDRVGLSVVSVLPTELLIEGVVPSELYRSAPFEALKAQAVAARGQVVVKLGARHLADPYMLCASTHCQVYKGFDQHHKITSSATRDTRGMIAMTQEGYPLDSVYSSTCGGHTEAYHEIWGGNPKPHLLGVEDNATSVRKAVNESMVEAFIKVPTAAFCQEPKRTFRWRVKRNATEILERLKTQGYLQGDELGDLVSFSPLHRGVSGRVQAVTYRGTQSSIVVYGDYVNRVILGVKSGLWVSELASEGTWIISGAGFGHGVGMCQHGAMGMAKGGAKMEDIIKHYYTGAQVQSLW